MNRLDRKILLSTLKNALRNVTAAPSTISHNNNNNRSSSIINNMNINNNIHNQSTFEQIKLENGIDYAKKRSKFQNNIMKQKFNLLFKNT